MVLASCRRHSLAGAVLLAVGLCWVAFLAAGPAPDAKKTPSEVDKTRKALDETITLEAADTPLGTVLSQIREQTKINFVVDKFTIQQQTGMDPDQMPVNAKLKGVKARGCLRSVLGPYNLGYAIIGDTVVISTDEAVMQRQVRQRVNVDLDNVSFADGLKQLAHDTGTPILLDPRVAKDAQTKVTVQLDDVPLETAVHLMAQGTELKPVRVGNVLFVTSKANAVAMRNDAVTDGMEGLPGEGGLKDGFKDKAK